MPNVALAVVAARLSCLQHRAPGTVIRNTRACWAVSSELLNS